MPNPIGYTPPSLSLESQNPGPSAPPMGVFSIARARAVNNISFVLPADSTQVVALPNTPANATQALIFIEAAAGSPDKAVLMRFWQDGSWPDQYSGIPLKDGQSFLIDGVSNVNNTRLISATGGSHVIQVQYFNS